MGVPLVWLCTLVAAVGGASLLWSEAQKHHKQEQGEHKAPQKRRKQQLTKSTSTAGTSAGIPHRELTALQSFLKRVYNWRGWQGGSFHFLQAWHEAEAAAATAAGGCWLPDFDGLQLSCGNCDKLLGVIDQTFFAGKILKRLKARPSQQQEQQQPAQQHGDFRQAADVGNVSNTKGGSRLQCKIVQAYGPNDTWLCYFDPGDNVIYLNRWRWGKHVTPEQPINCEGVVCTSRLQMLLHTLAHELVHAIIFHLFPEIDRSSPAYLPDGRHGPIFQLLNKQLFGHTSTALEHVQLLLSRH